MTMPLQVAAVQGMVKPSLTLKKPGESLIGAGWVEERPETRLVSVAPTVADPVLSTPCRLVGSMNVFASVMLWATPN